MKSTVFATLRVGDASVLIALVPDPEGRERAMTRALGYAISHLTIEPPEPIRRGLGALGRTLGALGDGETDERTALERIARACAAAIPGARLVAQRRLPVDQRAPRWPCALRSGAPSEEGHRIWPYDAELAGLLIGRRRLLLREALDPSLADADARWLAEHGVAVRRIGPEPTGGPQRIFGSLDAAFLEEAVAQHTAACSDLEGWAAAARWMGEALGYPRCCVDVFTRVRRRDDVTLFVERIPPLPHPPAPPLTVWLDGAIALVSHAPCSLGCAASRGLAAALLAELDRRSPGFAERWRTIAARLHAVTADGRTFALAAEGDLVTDGAARVRGAIELTPPEGRDLAGVVRPARELAGAELRVERGLLVAPAVDGWTATFVADHRGPDG
jgi:hypothetical protein